VLAIKLYIREAFRVDCYFISRPDGPVSCTPIFGSAMMFLVLASALLVTVYGQDPDPTKACLPDVLQLNVRSLYTNATGVFAYNFPAKMIAVRLNDGLHAVFNLTDNKVAVTQDFGKDSCLKYSTNGQETYRFGILSQCLPAGAKLLTPANTHLGLSPASLDIQAYELDTAGFGVARVAVTKSSPAVPVILQSIATGNGLITPDVQLLVNAKTSIDDSSIFDAPDDCIDWVG
jgi:hypothetical protein